MKLSFSGINLLLSDYYCTEYSLRMPMLEYAPFTSYAKLVLTMAYTLRI